MELVLDKDALSSLIQRNYADVQQGGRVVRIFLASGIIEPNDYCKVLSVRKGKATTRTNKKILAAIPLAEPTSPQEKPSDAIMLTWREFLDALTEPQRKETILKRKVTVKAAKSDIEFTKKKTGVDLLVNEPCDRILLVLV